MIVAKMDGWNFMNLAENVMCNMWVTALRTRKRKRKWDSQHFECRRGSDTRLPKAGKHGGM